MNLTTGSHSFHSTRTPGPREAKRKPGHKVQLEQGRRIKLLEDALERAIKAEDAAHAKTHAASEQLLTAKVQVGMWKGSAAQLLALIEEAEKLIGLDSTLRTMEERGARLLQAIACLALP